MGRFLSIDYGTKRVGLALSDESNTLAFSITPLSNNREEELIRKIKDIVKKYTIQKIVVGLPLGLENKETQMSQQIRSFTKNLQASIHIEVILLNETLTSEMAKINLRSLKKRKSIDSESARILLQEFLDNQKL
jgi:putative Holliday junction resolvase